MKKTALVLSGGGSRGAYEIGVWKALKELGVRIDMVFGTSVGAINGAMVAQGALEQAEELWLRMETDMIFDIESGGAPTEDALAYAREIVLHGGAGSTGLSGLLHKYINEKKVRRSKTDYGLVAVEFPSLKAHHFFVDDIPEGRLVDHIMASASCFPAVKKYEIEGVSYIDGGYSDNLPVSMALSRGADRIIAVDLEAVGVVDHEALEKASQSCDSFHLIKSPLSLGNFLMFDRMNTARIMRLGYLDTMRRFGMYDGERYTFEKGAFSDLHITGADSAAYFLELDPGEVYTKERMKQAASDRLRQLDTSSRLSEAMSRIRQIDSISDLSLMAAKIKDIISDADMHMALIIYIADDLRENEGESIFLSPHIFRLLDSEIQAAGFLNREGLLDGFDI